MDERRSPRNRGRDADPFERRAPAKMNGLSRLVHLLRNLWARPLGVQRQGRGLKLVLVERRRRRLSDEPPKVAQICIELRERLLGQQHAHAAQVMRHLVLVHDHLDRAGWPGVEGLPARVLGLATVQAEMLASVGPSVEMSHLVERLRIVKAAADAREEQEARQAHAARLRAAVPVEVAEAAEPVESGLDTAAGSWAGPVPVPVVIPDPNV